MEQYRGIGEGGQWDIGRINMSVDFMLTMESMLHSRLGKMEVMLNSLFADLLQGTLFHFKSE